jgi:hypothetical protein
MGVRINVRGTFRIPINFTVVTDSGKPENWSFTAEFKRLNQEECKALVEVSEDDITKLKQVLVGWKMEILGSGEDVPFNDETFAEFCKEPKVAGNTLLQFLEKVGANRQKP